MEVEAPRKVIFFSRFPVKKQAMLRAAEAAIFTRGVGLFVLYTLLQFNMAIGHPPLMLKIWRFIWKKTP